MVPADSEQPLAQLILKVVQLFQGVLAAALLFSLESVEDGFLFGGNACGRKATVRPHGKAVGAGPKLHVFRQISPFLTNPNDLEPAPERGQPTPCGRKRLSRPRHSQSRGRHERTVLFAAVLKGRRPSNQRAGSKGR